MHLANAGARVTMVVRGDRLGKSMSAYLVDRIGAHPLIDVRLHTQVDGRGRGRRRARARAHPRRRRARRARCRRRRSSSASAGTPRTGWAADTGVRVDPAGFILTGPDLLEAGQRPADWPLARDPLALETSVPGLFAAGDVRHGSTKRVGGAVGEGAMAVGLAHRRLDELFQTDSPVRA